VVLLIGSVIVLASQNESMLKDCPFRNKRVINGKNWKHVRIPIFLITTQ
jgi:hypothetical protein